MMATSKRGPSAPWVALALTALALWPSCGGQSIVYEDDGQGGESDGSDDSGFGGGPVGGTGVTGGVGFGGDFPQGGVGNAPSGGFGGGPSGGDAGTSPGGAGAFGGVSGVGGVGAFGGVSGFGGVGGIGPFGGASGIGGFSGSAGFAGISGRGGFAGVGGAGGSGGRAVGGRGGRGGRGGAGGMGGFAANPIDGFTFQTRCDTSTEQTCSLAPMGCPMGEMALPGVHPTDAVAVMPGTPGVFYDMTIRFQGVVESKSYSGGVDQDDYSSIVPADGFYTGGVPTTTSAMVYLIRVTSPARDYYLNSISPPSMSSIRPPTAVDYRGVIRVEGGTTVRLVSADSDCSALKNCGVTMTATECNPVSVANLSPLIADDVMQPYPGQFIGMVVESYVAVPAP